MATRLRKLRVDEISAVRRGANHGARHILLKSEDSMTAPTATPVDAFLGSIQTALHAAIKGSTPDGTVLADEDAVIKFVNDELGRAKTALLEPLPVEKCDDKDNKHTDDMEDDEEMDETTKSAVAKAQTEAEEANRRAEASERRIKKMEDEASAAAAVTLAKGYVDGFPAATADELGPILQKLSPAESKVIEKLCKAGREALSASKLTEEIGKRGQPDAASATGMLDSLANEIIKNAVAKSGERPITYAQAYERACTQRPDLYALAVQGK